jgi:vacuolar-type H+-ATPase subunit I/STV1
MLSRINQTAEINKSNKNLQLIINIYLLIGVTTLVITLFYLLFNLSISDKIIYKCIPSFMFGLSSIIIYGFLDSKKTMIKR